MTAISTEHYETLRAWTKQYIIDHCLIFDYNNRIKSKVPGEYYQWIFMLRRGLYNPKFLSAISQMVLYHLDGIFPDNDYQLSGRETAAAPMIAGISLVARMFDKDINGFIVRKARKDYGLGNMIEGMPNDHQVVLVDDLANSSNSLRMAYDEVMAEGLNVAPVAFVLVNKSHSEIHDERRMQTDMFLPPSIQILSLFTLEDFGLTNPSH
jgi:orotate phosphoribosyltransferase